MTSNPQFKDEYYLFVEWSTILKEIKKYPRNVITKIKRDVTALNYCPEKNADRIDSYKSATLYKKRFQEIEMYYSVEGISVFIVGFYWKGRVDFFGIETGIKSGRAIGHSTIRQKQTIEKI